MCTGGHAHIEAWAGRESVKTKKEKLRRGTMCLIRLCIEKDVGNEASAREMKRALESVFKGLCWKEE